MSATQAAKPPSGGSTPSFGSSLTTADVVAKVADGKFKSQESSGSTVDWYVGTSTQNASGGN